MAESVSEARERVARFLTSGDPDRLAGYATLDPDQLGQLLGTLLLELARAWPVLAAAAARRDPDGFLEHLGARAPKDGTPEALRQVCLVDLYLAWACIAELPGALSQFLDRHGGDIRGTLQQMRLDRASLEEAEQRVRQKLFVAEEGMAPKLALYTGQGDLRSWLRVLVAREGISLIRRTQREVPLEEHAEVSALPTQEDPELGHLRTLYRAEFKGSFEEALAALAPRDRNVLRYRLLDRLSIDEVGAIYQVHRATVARWEERIRRELAESTRAALRRRLRVGANELESLIRLADSQLDVSIERLLNDEKERSRGH
jgi:RNA polymerase sigma-70 factor (ECF subfamily)